VNRQQQLVDEGKAAVGRGDGAAARQALEHALGSEPGGEVLELLSQAAYLELDVRTSVGLLERAYAAYRDEGDAASTVRVARQIAYMNGAILGDGAVFQGWIARAQTLLADAEESSERGWVALNMGMFEGDRATKERLFLEALDIALRFGDDDLHFVTLAYYGASLVHGDRTEEGMLRLDEACAAIAGSDVEDFFLFEEIFCQLFSACEYAHDIARADQWIRIGDEIASRRNLPSVSAFCRTHYGGLLTAAGRWNEADEALTEAVRLWGLGFGSLRGGALVRLADLRVRQGRLEEAEQLLDGMDAFTEAARPIAAIHLARRNTALAAEVIERALSQMDPSGASAAGLWALIVDVHLSTGAVDEATTAVERLVDIGERHPSHYLRATAALARGRLCLVAGSGDAKACLNEALSGFAEARMPVEVAHVRLTLADALSKEQPEVALAEAKAALEAFEQLRAARMADSAAALMRKLGGPARTGPKGLGGIGVLTKREAEVLDLLGLGLSNPEIGDRLFITRKTVEHHVGNVLSKLGLRSRAEAAAYLARSEKPGP
jgi:DNA-binding CsgD family transcriptional regulator